MSFRENVDDQTDWEPTSSENYFDGSDAYNEQSLAEELRVPVDVVGTARDLERYGINDEEEEEEGDGDEDEERETRATDAMTAYDNLFPLESSLTSGTPNLFSTHNLHCPNYVYDEEPTRFFRGHEQRIPDVNDVIDPYANFNDLSIPATTGHTRFQPDVQYHEPRPRLLNPTAQEILQAFFNGNPYPETEDKTSLAQLTKIRVSQVENWFRNTRQRQVSHPVSSLLTPPIQEPSCIGQDSASTGQYQVFQQNGRLGDYSGFGFTPIHMEDRGVVASLYGSQGSTGGYDRHRPSLQAYQAVPPRDDVPPVTVSRSVIGFQTTRSLEPTIEDKQRMGRSGGSSTSWAQVPQEADLRSFDMSRESIQVSAASNINSTKPGRQVCMVLQRLENILRNETAYGDAARSAAHVHLHARRTP
ncbi:hypothetical protein MMC08_009149 [Hypocenomyce scalaris]|nr:hypothetical protein [Hypocenomyce scalaris]